MKYRKISLTLFVTGLFLPMWVAAEIGSMKVDHYCSFNDKPLPAILTTFDSDNAAQQALKRVMSYTGLPPRFEILAADVPNAAAVIRNKKRYILYNQRFMRKVRDTTKNNWPEIGVLAHEIAHHLSNHTFEASGSRPKFELEADRFSGFVLQKMGASLDDAVAVMQHMVSEKGSLTHPARSARVAAVTNGWVDAEEKAGGNQFKRDPVDPVAQKPQHPANDDKASRHDHKGREHAHPLPESGSDHTHVRVKPKSGPIAVSQPTMIFIRGGRFMMGSPATEKERVNPPGDVDERAHKVSVADFSIGKHEVTVGEFRQFVDNTGYSSDAEQNAGNKKGCYVFNGKEWGYTVGYNWKKPGFAQTDEHPVVCISARDALAYSKWLSNETGQRYGLTTEAQWEYAARADTTSARYWGDSPEKACVAANVSDQSARRVVGWKESWGVHSCNDGRTYTASVGRYKANGWGLKDVLGNVWELTCSVYVKNYQGSEEQCATNNNSRDFSIRGGSWRTPASAVRSAARSWSHPSDRTNNTGFRLARAL